jgi:hypothetical protein
MRKPAPPSEFIYPSLRAAALGMVRIFQAPTIKTDQIVAELRCLRRLKGAFGFVWCQEAIPAVLGKLMEDGEIEYVGGAWKTCEKVVAHV